MGDKTRQETKGKETRQKRKQSQGAMLTRIPDLLYKVAKSGIYTRGLKAKVRQAGDMGGYGSMWVHISRAKDVRVMTGGVEIKVGSGLR